MRLFIGNQNYSTWSLRAWIIFFQYELDVEVVKLKLFTPEFYKALETVNPAGKVPALEHDELYVWDSLAILEYINEAFLQSQAWPKDIAQRAKARAISCEMHSGFCDLRNELPMNCRATRRVDISEKASEDIARIDQIWSQQMSEFPGGWLFGDWSIADAMFAPVVLRFKTYRVSLSAKAELYQQKTLNSKAIQRWLAEAGKEQEIVTEDEAGEPV